MIADSDYDAGELICRPSTGLIAGPAAAIFMLVIVAVLQRPEGTSLWLRDVGRVILPASIRTPVSLLVAGACLHIGLGGVFGVLYMACQQRVAAAGMIVVGAFYGFVLWLASDLIVFRWLGAGSGLLPTGAGVLMMIVFGVTLASCAMLQRRVWSRRDDTGKPVD